MRRLAAAAPVVTAVVLGACAARGVRSAAPDPLIVFMSDFGTTDDSVAICKGVMLEIEPRARIFDITHQVQPYAIGDGARLLGGTAPHYPRGSVFVVVIDPGVGSARKAIAARTRGGRLFVLPDNGLLTSVDAVDPVVEVREITNQGFMRRTGPSSTFHGRDVFSPAAAHLAAGAPFTDVGPVVADWVRLHLARARLTPEALVGEVIGLDGPYGNLVTDVPAELFSRLGYALGETVRVSVGGQAFSLPFVRTFSDVPEGKGLLYIDSRGRLSLAINMGDFARTHGITPPVELHVPIRDAR
jgi:S-adenosylmethionine hydrolase